MSAEKMRAEFARLTAVSRETMERMDAYEGLIRKWNPAINLVSKGTLASIWSRHFLDSAQISQLSTAKSGTWADFGSGAGFPGLVVAVLGLEQTPEMNYLLIESDARKAAFLANAIRQLGVRAAVCSDRIEALECIEAAVVSARAVAPLAKLLDYAAQHLANTGSAFFSKGATWEQEVIAAQKDWLFDFIAHQSKTDPKAVVLEIKGINRV
jgi:16S rRNA (guanine527-N7)-methyltransferase